MSIIRVTKRERFVTIEKTGIEDGRLSFRATGLLAYLLSKPDRWTINYRDLIQRKTEGKTAVLRALKELETTGYLQRERKHVGGRYQWEQVLYEVPHNEPETGALSKHENNALKTGASSEEGLSEKPSNAPLLNPKAKPQLVTLVDGVKLVKDESGEWVEMENSA